MGLCNQAERLMKLIVHRRPTIYLHTETYGGIGVRHDQDRVPKQGRRVVQFGRE
jgi:hypothetical protein